MEGNSDAGASGELGHGEVALLEAELGAPERVLLSTLTEFYIEARYPGDRAKLSTRCDGDFARTILDDTREMVVWLESQLKSS